MQHHEAYLRNAFTYGSPCHRTEVRRYPSDVASGNFGTTQSAFIDTGPSPHSIVGSIDRSATLRVVPKARQGCSIRRCLRQLWHDAPRRAPIDLPPPPRIHCKKEVARRGASGD